MYVSVCLATYNGEKYLAEQIMSILPQLKDGDEFLISDDGSTDKTLDILDAYKSRIHRILVGQVGGVNKNFERLIMQSNREIIVLADQDDVWLPGHLCRMRGELLNYKVVMTNGIVVNEKLVPTTQTIFDFVGKSQGFFSNLFKNTYVGCCLAFRKELIKNALPFDDSLPAHDWMIGLLGEISGGVCRIDVPSILYRRHNDNASLTGLRSQNSLKKKFMIRVQMLKIISRCLFLDQFSR